MTAALIGAALGCFALGATADLAAGTRHGKLRPVPHLLAVAGALLAAWAGARAVAGSGFHGSLAGTLGIPGAADGADRLTGLFLLATFAPATLVELALASWVRPEGRVRRGLGAAANLVLGAMVGVFVARDAFTFLLAWEAVTLALFVLASLGRSPRVRAGFLTLAIGKVGGASLLFGLLLLSARSHGIGFGAWRGLHGAAADAAYVLLVAGFGAKLGSIPFQVWMPEAYPAAPGPARALMAGLAANVGVYGLWRVLSILGSPPEWLAIAVLLVGAATALLGIAHAAVQGDLNRVIAYSSIENGGLLLATFGIALTGAVAHDGALIAVGMLAGSLHMVAHSLGKSTVYVAGAHLESALGTSDLEDLRGVGRALPWSATGLAAGSLALAGLPPTVGFVSEWFILEALMQQFRLTGVGLKLAMAGAGALIALTAGVALLVFARVIGLVALGGRPADGPDGRTTGPDAGWTGRLSLAVLAAACLGVAAATPLEVRVLAAGLDAVVPADLMRHALASPFVLQPVFPGFSILSPSWMFVWLPALFLLALLVAVALSRGRVFRARRVPAWRSGAGHVAGKAEYSAFGYANPMRHVLAAILRTRRHVARGSVATTAEEDGDDDDDLDHEGHIHYRSDVVEAIEAYLYDPVQRGLLRASAAARRLQSGRLGTYVAWLLVTFLVALVVASFGR